MGATAVGNLSIIVGANAVPFDREMGRISRDMNSGKGMTASVTVANLLSNSISKVADLTGQAAINMARLGMEYEATAVRFGVLAGETRGAKLLGDVQNLAIRTPFTSNELVSSSEQLLGMGVNIDSILPAMSRLGDIAAGDGERLKRLAYAAGQVSAAGKFMGTELRQFTEAGVGVADFSAAAGMSAMEFRAAMENGTIGADVMWKAINKLTSEGGRFAGMNEKVSQTVKGQWNALTESVTLASQKIATQAFSRFDVAGKIGSVADLLGPLQESAGPIMDAMERVGIIGVDAFAIVKAGALAVWPTIREIGSVVYDVLPTFGEFREFASSAFRTVGMGVATFGTVVANLGGLVLEGLSPYLPILGYMIDGFRVMGAAGAAALAALGAPELAASLGAVIMSFDGAKLTGGIQTAMDKVGQLGQRTNLAASFANQFDRSMQSAAASSRKAADAIGEIPTKWGPTPQVQQIATQLKSNMVAGENPLQQFQKQFQQITSARFHGLITTDLWEPGVAKAFTELESVFAKMSMVHLPKAIKRGTQEAESAISRAMSRTESRDPMQRVEMVLRAMQRDAALSKEYERQTAEGIKAFNRKFGVVDFNK